MKLNITDRVQEHQELFEEHVELQLCHATFQTKHHSIRKTETKSKKENQNIITARSRRSTLKRRAAASARKVSSLAPSKAPAFAAEGSEPSNSKA